MDPRDRTRLASKLLRWDGDQDGLVSRDKRKGRLIDGVEGLIQSAMAEARVVDSYTRVERSFGRIEMLPVTDKCGALFNCEGEDPRLLERMQQDRSSRLYILERIAEVLSWHFSGYSAAATESRLTNSSRRFCMWAMLL